jgi:hypothetical protein
MKRRRKYNLGGLTEMENTQMVDPMLDPTLETENGGGEDKDKDKKKRREPKPLDEKGFKNTADGKYNAGRLSQDELWGLQRMGYIRGIVGNTVVDYDKEGNPLYQRDPLERSAPNYEKFVADVKSQLTFTDPVTRDVVNVKEYFDKNFKDQNYLKRALEQAQRPEGFQLNIGGETLTIKTGSLKELKDKIQQFAASEVRREWQDYYGGAGRLMFADHDDQEMGEDAPEGSYALGGRIAGVGRRKYITGGEIALANMVKDQFDSKANMIKGSISSGINYRQNLKDLSKMETEFTPDFATYRRGQYRSMLPETVARNNAAYRGFTSQMGGTGTGNALSRGMGFSSLLQSNTQASVADNTARNQFELADLQFENQNRLYNNRMGNEGRMGNMNRRNQMIAYRMALRNKMMQEMTDLNTNNQKANRDMSGNTMKIAGSESMMNDINNMFPKKAPVE